ncbi:hypothetical protein KEM48_000993 [Puccinia striiformis f. sp. tritici PST-130]|nr:hypothetical protein KEM48_000993 [Puccinia striiformis f. sp. tritici PST-130]
MNEQGAVIPESEMFIEHATDQGPRFVCIPCGRKNMLKDKKRHARRATHKQQVIKWLARGRDQPVPGESLSDTRRPVNREEVNQEQQIHDKVDYEADNEAAVNTTSPAANTEEEVRETLEELREHEENRCYQQAEWEREQAPDMSYESWIKYELERIREDEDLDNPADEVHDDGEVDETRDAEEWFPFKNKMEFVGSLLVGYTRNCISRTLFDQIRSILNPICNLKIPAWSTIRRAQKRIREYLHMEPTMKPSVLGTPCATLSTISALQKEIANPLVAPHIDFYPEDSQGKNQFKLSQSKKWLELPRDYRPQMCVNNTRHFFIFEPVELFSKQILVPIYLYKFENKTHSKCVAPTLRRTNSGKHEMRIPANIGFDDPRLVTIKAKEFNVEYSKIQINGRLLSSICDGHMYEVDEKTRARTNLPNEWREKSGNRIIRNMPISLYSDDTSGNISKRWNKHISFYFTLSGLPPNLSNQEYNCHFLATSNRAGVLELSELIVDELNEIATNGFEAYDAHLCQPVWVMSTVLFFLGDSPMHADITNTPFPGSALNPCRMCTLSAPTKVAKKLKRYVRNFFEVDRFGNPCPNPRREWPDTIQHSHNLFKLATEGDLPGFKKKTKEWGVTDRISESFIQGQNNPQIRERIKQLEKEDKSRLYNPFLRLKGFDGCLETRHPGRNFACVLAWSREVPGAFFFRQLQPKYLTTHAGSLIGKEFKIFLQSAPFLLFPYMDQNERSLWHSLSLLCSYAFQTHIDNMETFITELEKHIANFLYWIMRSSSQWTNKPKFHIIVHLPESIRRFGPAPLFSTEKFESYNGVLRNASIHSNRLAPGRDIAIKFADYLSLRFLASGGRIYDKNTRTTSQASPAVLNLFQNNVSIQKSMGYDATLAESITHFPHERVVPLSKAEKTLAETQLIPIPTALQREFPGRDFRHIACLQLNKHERISRDYFVLVKSTTSEEYIGRVNSIWSVSTHIFVNVTKFQMADFRGYYGMTEFCKTTDTCSVESKDIVCTLNLQHNCHDGRCPIKMNKTTQIERQEASTRIRQVCHTDQERFILNLTSFHAPKAHRRMSANAFSRVVPETCVAGLNEGHEIWRKKYKQPVKGAKVVWSSDGNSCT